MFISRAGEADEVTVFMTSDPAIETASGSPVSAALSGPQTAPLPIVQPATEACGSHDASAPGDCSSHGAVVAASCGTPTTAACESKADGPVAETALAEAMMSEASKETRLLDALKTVIDPELMVNIVDLGLVYAVEHVGNRVSIEMTLTSPACPAGPQIIQQARMALERLRDVDEVEIRLVMSPPWTPERMTDEARDMLGIF